MRSLKNSLLLLVTLLVMSVVTVKATYADSPADEQPLVTKAVAPYYPAVAKVVRVSDKVVVLVKINTEGEVTSAQAESGHQFFRKVSETAAKKWRFATAARGLKERAASLTFIFRIVEDAKHDETSFNPPYQIEIVIPPPIIEQQESYKP